MFIFSYLDKFSKNNLIVCKKSVNLCTKLLKLNIMQSLQRQIKRGHARLTESLFIKNEDGSPKIILEKRSKRGKWYKS